MLLHEITGTFCAQDASVKSRRKERSSPWRRRAKIRVRLIHQVMGDLFVGLTPENPAASTENEFTLRIADRRPDCSENCWTFAFSSGEQSAKHYGHASIGIQKEIFPFRSGWDCPKFKLRLQVHHAIRRVITLSNFLSLLFDETELSPCLLALTPVTAHFIIAYKYLSREEVSLE